MVSNDDPSELRQEEEAARERLRETEAEAAETLDEAEELEEPDVPEESKARE